MSTQSTTAPAITEPLLIQRQRAVLRELARLVAEKTAAETALEANVQAKRAAAEKEHLETKERLAARAGVEKAAADKEYQETKQALAARFETDYAAAKKEYAQIKEAIEERYEDTKEKAEKEHEEVRWTTTTMFEAKEKAVKTPFESVQQQEAVGRQKILALKEETEKQMQQWRRAGLMHKLTVTGKHNRHHEEPARNVKACVVQAEESLQELKQLVLPRFFKGVLPWVVLVVFWLLLAAGIVGSHEAGRLVGRTEHWAIGAGCVGLLMLATVMLFSLAARFSVRETYKPLATALADGEFTCQRWLHLATKKYQEQMAEVEQARKTRDADLAKNEEKYRRTLTQNEKLHDEESRQCNEKYPRLLTALEQRRDQGLRQCEEKYRRALADSKQRFETENRQNEEKHNRIVELCQKEETEGRQNLAKNLLQRLAKVRDVALAIIRESGQLFPPWNHPSWQQWTPAPAPPPVIRFGEYQLDLLSIAGSLFDKNPPPSPPPARGREGWGGLPPQFNFPALMLFPQRCSLLYRVRDQGRQVAVDNLQTVMFRFLTTLPPGKVRFTIIDPVGLGENFSAFMHLADYDELLVTSRIWTEPQQIEQRLADIAAHMENVIQKYLRNQFASIEDYNAEAGEVAEPFRILVVANFPVNFSPEAARRLLSIAGSGRSCGVYTLVSVDTKQPMPQGFNLADLEQTSVTLTWKDQRFHWKENELGNYPLKLDTPPPAELFTRLIHAVGKAAKEGSRVEVPFDFIAPTQDKWWTFSTKTGIDVPLGRAGATKRQHLKLGHGTSQHVLIAGKTGSGKSTLLHALITNLALTYSPEECELYLVDFKKGVEFKTYVTHQLPHARVIAIESEREFGLSVLQRLDAELKSRGDRFRQLGVQNLADYRAAAPGTACPRILFIVDEFQEFFVEDDKISQEAALLLDRLVRQGRAFGLHVLLGSQTLGGAYSLARSTIDQMAVRIALQCSEADANLILSKDNSAARLLTRPGEAIYNAANGLLEGNDIFQVVWLPDERREQLLQGVRELSRRRKPPTQPSPRAGEGWVGGPQIVFEGNIPADIHKNHLFTKALETPSWPTAPRAFQAWLGEAIAIKDATAATFRRQSSSNLLLIGQQEEASLGVLATGLISLAAQVAPASGTNHEPAAQARVFDPSALASAAGSQCAEGGARFCIIDGMPADSSFAGFWTKIAKVLPHPVQVGGWRELPVYLAEIAAEVERRQKAPPPFPPPQGGREGWGAESPPIFLLIHSLHRFKDLRKQEDDFGFSSRRGGEKTAIPPPQLLETIAREGPTVGVHTLVWCDTLTNLQRCFDRQLMRDFEMRVLFQMSSNDSSTLIDSPLASRLGVNRALFCSEDQNLMEKFRPYSLPTDAWLSEVTQKLARKQLPAPSPARV